jgi:serine/threonine protein kinase/WD40 repeat protein
MSDNDSSVTDPFGRIADEFVEAFRQGQRPSVEEFARRYPEHADEIREVLPALVLMEKAKASVAPDQLYPGQAASDAAPLQQLGDYQILREIGRGGMGVVYEAQQLSLGRHVAIKVLPSTALLDPRQLGRFQREARSAARLHHTNIVPVFGVGEQDGLHYYVMQFIPGLGLDVVLDELRRLRQPRGQQAPTRADAPSGPTDVTRDASAVHVAHGLLTGEFRQPESAGTLATPAEEPAEKRDESRPQDASDSSLLPHSSSLSSLATIHLPGQSGGSALSESGHQYWHSVARVGIQVADALAHAASQGILHRDIKPSNLLLDETGNVWVTDFGLAKAASDSDNLTHTGDIVGTLRYMAPERFSGQGDSRSDMYSLGLTLYELLTLRPAFDETDRNTLIKRVMHDEPVRPRKVNPGVPRDLETVVLKSIARDPGRRYRTPAAMGDDLKSFIDGRPIAARRTTELEKLWMWARRRPGVSGLVAALFLCLLAGAIVSTVLAVRAEEFARAADSREKDATQARDAATGARRALSDALADSYVTLGQVAGDRGDAALAALWFAKAVMQAEGDADREAINRIRVRHWTAEGILAPVAAIDVPSHAQRLEFHPGGRYLAGRTETGDYTVWDLGTSTVWQGPPGFEKLTAVAWDRDGTRVVLGVQDRAGVFAFPSGKTIRTWDWPGPVTAAALSPDGTRLALGGTAVQVWDLKADRRASPRWVVPRPLHAIAFSPDGSRVVAVGTDPVMRVYGIAGDRSESEFSTPNQPSGPPQFLDGGVVVLTFPTANTAAAVDLGTGKVRFRLDLRGDNGWEFKLAISPDGKSIWAPSVVGTSSVRGWNSAGKPIASGFPHLNQVFSLAVSPDGSLLASGAWDRTLRIWDLKTRTLRFPEMVSISSPVTVAWSPDGREVAAAYEGRYLRVWALPPGLPVRTIEPGGAISMARFTPDGRSILPWGGSNHRASQRQVRLYDPATGQPISAVVDARGVVLAADISADGRRLVTAISHQSERADESFKESVMFGPEGGEVRFWDVASGRPEGDPIKVPAEPRDVRFRPDGSEAAVVCAGREVLILDPATGRVKRTFHPKPFKLPTSFHVGNHQLCYSRDGRRLYVYGPNGCGLEVLDSETGESLLASGLEVFDMRESADGSVVAVAYGRNDLLVRQFHTRTFQEVAPPIKHPDWVFSVRFDRTGDRLLTACRDRAARLWDRKTGQMLAVFAHENEVTAAELVGEDRFVLSVGHDEVARLSDTATGRPIGPPIKLGGLGLSLDVSPDGRWAVTGGFTTRLTVLDLEAITRPAEGTPDELLRRAELMAGRRIDAHGGVVNLTADEWKDRWEDYRRVRKN